MVSSCGWSSGTAATPLIIVSAMCAPYVTEHITTKKIKSRKRKK